MPRHTAGWPRWQGGALECLLRSSSRKGGTNGRVNDFACRTNGRVNDFASREPTTESTTSPPEPSLDMTAVCGRFSAVPREGVFHKKGCKCRHESYLSLACGKGLGLRKFDPHNEEVQDPNCKCIDEGEQIRKGQVTGPLAEPPAPMAKMAPPSGTLSPEEMDNYEDQASSMPEVRCKIPPPEPFHFGDMVRINKQVDDGHYFEFAGIGRGGEGQ
ncbi:unnamed protein product [Effrenium voratum]|nr:unnamed protein product [Effrenium voratum]